MNLNIMIITFAMFHAVLNIIRRIIEVKNTIYGNPIAGMIMAKVGMKINAKKFAIETTANASLAEKLNKARLKIMAQNYQSIILDEKIKQTISTE